MFSEKNDMFVVFTRIGLLYILQDLEEYVTFITYITQHILQDPDHSSGSFDKKMKRMFENNVPKYGTSVSLEFRNVFK
jgi:hypothetical protein